MKNLIRFCIGRPVTVIMIITAIFMGGVLCLSAMPMDRLPEILLPQVTIETEYPGMSAADLRSAVTIPLEDAMSVVKGLEGIRSVSRDGVSLINLGFRWGTDPSSAAALVREAVDRVYPGLPHGVKKPAVVSGSIGEEPHAIIAIRSKNGDNVFARNFAEYEMKARLRRLDGIGAVILSGGEISEARIRVNPERMVSRGFNGDELANAIAMEIADIPAGNAREGDRELTVVSQGRPKSMEELSALILPSASGPLDLGNLGLALRETAPKKSVFLFENEEQCALEIYRRPGSDPVSLTADIKKTLAIAAEDFSRDIAFCLVWDSSSSIINAIRNLIVSSVLAAAAVAIILCVFIRHFRSSFFAALAIPVSAAAAIILLKLCGRSLNSMSLCGLAMGIGLVSDASVIVLDIFNRSHIRGHKPSVDELGAMTCSVSGSSLAGTITTCVVFIPVIFLPGPLGALFGDLAISLVGSVVTGWVYAQFLLPAIFLYFYSEGKFRNNNINPDDSIKPNNNIKPYNGSEKIYGPLLEKIIRRPLPFMAAAMAFSVLGIFLLVQRPADFIITEEADEIEVVLDFPPGSLPEAAAVRAREFSLALSAIKPVSYFYGKMGAEDEDTGRRADPGYSRERMLFRCFLKNNSVKEEALAEIRNELEKINCSDINVSVDFPRDKTGKLLGFSPSHTLLVRGTDHETVTELCASTAEAVWNSAGSILAAVNMRPSGTRPELRFYPDRQASAFCGISASKIAGAIYAMTEGIISGFMEIDGRPMDIRVSGNFSGYSQGNLEMIPLVFGSSNGNARPVFLGSLGKIERRETESTLARQDRSDVLYLDLVPQSGREKDFLSFFNKLPSAFTKADESVFARYSVILCVTLILVILLLYLVMASQFESFVLPLIILLSIPFAMAGAGPVLLIAGAGLDSGSVLGLVVLFGLTVNNGIILYEAAALKIAKGIPAAEAVYVGALERFRPVMITSLTTVFGLLPLLFSSGASQRSMAAAMLGGLTASTALTIFALPPVFVWLFNPGKRNG